MRLERIDGSLILTHEKKSVEALLSEAVKARMDLTDLYLKDATLKGLDFFDRILTNALLEGCTITDCDFSGANLSRARFTDCRVDSTHFRGADLTHFDLQRCHLTGCNLSSTPATYSTFANVNFTNCDLHGIHSDDITAIQCRFQNCDMRGLRIKKVLAKNSTFIGCDLRNSKLSVISWVGSKHQDCKCENLLTDQPPFTDDGRQAAEKRAGEWAKMFDDLRIERGWTTAFVAEAVGANEWEVKMMGEGIATLSVPRLISLCRLFQITLGDLYYGAKPNVQTCQLSEDSLRVRDTQHLE